MAGIKNFRKGDSSAQSDGNAKRRYSSVLKKTSFSRPKLLIFILAFALIGYLIFRAFASPNPNLPGDLNNDNTVNVTDLSILLSNYGTTNSTADINGDGTVNVLDMSILLSNYGKNYTPPPPPSGWYPTPPSSYSSTGTFTKSVVVDTATGNQAGYGLYYTFRRVVVRSSTGTLFMVYNFTESNDHATAYWRLKKSTDGGSTWTLVRDSQAAGDPNNGGVAPALEIDPQDNVYVIVSQYKSTDQVFRVFKFSPADSYTSPTIFRYGSFPAANKWSAVYDQTRNWIWISSWERGADGTPDLIAIDQNGNIKVSKQVMIGYDDIPSRHAHAEYVHLDITPDGTLVRGWSGTGEIMNQTNGPLNFYDVRFIWSPDAGTTWYNASGPLAGTAYPDDTGPVNRSGTNVTDLTPGVEFISGNDPNYWPNGTAMYNFNNLGNMVFNGNALHFFDVGSSPSSVVGTQHHPHIRWNWTTKTVDVRQENLAATSGTTTTIDGTVTGAFARASTEAGRLYFMGNGGGSDYQHIVVLKSDDNGSTWARYAVSGLIGSNPAYTNVSRWIYPDGKIYGATIQNSSPYYIYFFEVSPN